MDHQLEFSDWFKFDDYLKRDDRKLPGVYVLAHFGRKNHLLTFISIK